MGATPVVGGMNIVLAGDSVTFSQAVDAAQKKLDQLSGRTRKFGSDAEGGFTRASRGADSFGHSSVSSMQAASGALRELNGNFTNNIRAVERLITMVPGLGNALKVAFPLIGGVAFGAMIVENVIKVNEFIKTSRLIPKTIADGFSELNGSARLANDALAVENARLDMTLAKLQHKPENGLALGLAEVVEQADKGTKALQDEINKVDELMKKNRTGFWQGVMGQASTDPDAKEITGYNAKIGQISASFNGDIDAAAGRGEKANVIKLTQDRLVALEAVYAEGTAKIGSRLKDLQDLQRSKSYKAFGGDDLTARINQARGALQAWDEEQKQLGGEFRKGQTQDKIAPLEAAKGNGEAARKAAEVQFKGMEADLAQQKLLHGMTLKDDYDFWDSRRSLFTTGSQEYNAILEKQAQLAMESAKASHEAITRFNTQGRKEEASERERAMQDAAKGVAGFTRAGQATTNQGYIDSDQLAIVEAHNAAHEKEAAIMDRAGRSVTQYAAALQMAQVHAQEFAAEMTSLQAILAVRQSENSGANASAGTSRAVEEAQAAILRAQSQRTIQAQGDNDAMYGRQTSGLVGSTDALDAFTRRMRDSAAMVGDFTAKTVTDFNTLAITALTTRTTGHEDRQAFGNFGAGLFRSAAGAGLNKLEGSGLSMLGFGGGHKPTGAAGDPLHVVMANVSSAASSTMDGLGKVISGTKSALNGSSGGVKGFVGGLLKMISGGGGAAGAGADAGADGAAADAMESIPFPMFAEGGIMSPNSWNIIGERGPELMYTGSGGTVVPNNKVSIGGGGGDTHNWNIDARGSTNPAQTKMMVQQGIMAAAPKIAAGAVHAQKENRFRQPSNRG